MTRFEWAVIGLLVLNFLAISHVYAKLKDIIRGESYGVSVKCNRILKNQGES